MTPGEFDVLNRAETKLTAPVGSPQRVSADESGIDVLALANARRNR